MFQKRLGGDGASHEVNLTPLIDVSLVLVVILLLATPLAFQSSIGLRGARSSGREANDAAAVERIELTVLSADSLRVNETLVARADLEWLLPPLLEKSADRRVIVHCGEDIPHGAFVAVLDDAKWLGAADIAMVGR